MLAAPHRLRSRHDFDAAVRRGRRAGRPLLTLHLLLPTTAEATLLGPPRAGLVVSKAVGSSVVRHRVARQLRHLLRDRIGALAAGTSLVVRAAPAAATATSRDLAADLDAGLRRLAGPAPR